MKGTAFYKRVSDTNVLVEVCELTEHHTKSWYNCLGYRKYASTPQEYFKEFTMTNRQDFEKSKDEIINYFNKYTNDNE